MSLKDMVGYLNETGFFDAHINKRVVLEIL